MLVLAEQLWKGSSYEQMPIAKLWVQYIVFWQWKCLEIRVSSPWRMLWLQCVIFVSRVYVLLNDH